MKNIFLLRKRWYLICRLLHETTGGTVRNEEFSENSSRKKKLTQFISIESKNIKIDRFHILTSYSVHLLEHLFRGENAKQ